MDAEMGTFCWVDLPTHTRTHAHPAHPRTGTPPLTPCYGGSGRPSHAAPPPSIALDDAFLFRAAACHAVRVVAFMVGGTGMVTRATRLPRRSWTDCDGRDPTHTAPHTYVPPAVCPARLPHPFPSYTSSIALLAFYRVPHRILYRHTCRTFAVAGRTATTGLRPAALPALCLFSPPFPRR